MNKHFYFRLIIAIALCSCQQQTGKRTIIGLNGEWDITKTASFELVPNSFESKVVVPGLVDMATPAIDTDRKFDNGVYWHRKTFTIDSDIPEAVNLRIAKAKYHAKVFVNGKFAGEQLYCFTPAMFNIKEFLNTKGEKNELVIGIGTSKQMPDSVIWGFDKEKLTYIPGIYDNVELRLSNYPRIKNIQTVPLIEESKVRIVADIDFNGKKQALKGRYQIRELASQKVVAEGKVTSNDFSVSIPNCQLWSPDTPFLYELQFSTQADQETLRFGMRSFSFDTETKRPLLNGKPYMMNGTNVCILRFFEDPDRQLLPWDKQWAVKLHSRFKEMNWNSIRYCIGFPPESWYDVADSIGFIIQDEYPIWTGGYGRFKKIYPGVNPERLANEFREWMPSHWNHPSVAIWDAQNETVSKVTGAALSMVRDLDLSNRPWENGWSTPQAAGDPIESHPYLYMRYRKDNVNPSSEGALKDLLSVAQYPGNSASERMPQKNKEKYPNPIIINEYAWLWLNRNGSPTTLTDRVYDVVFGDDLTPQERIYQYCRHQGMLTEYWRTQGNIAGIMHFCGLGYSRPKEPRGQTSDSFIDIKNLVYEPMFVKHVKSSFAPVCLMIDYWDVKVNRGEKINLDIFTINDLTTDWSGELKIQILKGSNLISAQSKEISVVSSCKISTPFNIEMPTKKGDYKIIASIQLNGEEVISMRELNLN